MTRYKNLLCDIREYLERYNVPSWPERLGQWAAELDNLEVLNYRKHLLRTQKSLGGMGSIGDIVICPEAGHKISTAPQAINAANAGLLSLVKELHKEVAREVGRVNKFIDG